MGSIYKRGNIYWLKYYQDGKPIRESSKSSREADARKLLRKREGEIAEGKRPGVYFDRVSFDDLAADYILDYKVNGKKTLAKAERVVRLHLEPFFGRYSATRINTPLIRKYIAYRLDQGASNATINRELSAIKRMFNLASSCTPPKVAQVPYIPMLKEQNVRRGFFEHDEFLALREALPPHLKGMVTFAYKSGWRVGEITGLTWNMVDLKQGVARLEAGTTKNGDGRTIYLDAELADVFREQFRNRQLGCPYVFHRRGAKIGRFDKSWHRACKRAGVDGRIFHDLRRTAIRNMVRAGVNERVAMTISGHKTRSVFDRYNIVNDEDLRRASGQVSEFLREKDGHKNGHKNEKRG